MNVDDMLTELRDEAIRLDEAILAMDRLLNSRGKRRGRPPNRPSASDMQRRGHGEDLQPEPSQRSHGRD